MKKRLFGSELNVSEETSRKIEEAGIRAAHILEARRSELELLARGLGQEVYSTITRYFAPVIAVYGEVETFLREPMGWEHKKLDSDAVKTTPGEVASEYESAKSAARSIAQEAQAAAARAGLTAAESPYGFIRPAGRGRIASNDDADDDDDVADADKGTVELGKHHS